MITGAQQDSHEAAVLPYCAVLTALAAVDANRVALVCDGPDGSQQFTRGELEAWANRLARAYCELGLRQGDYAAVVLPNGPEFFAACLAIWKLGAAPNPVSHRLPPPERAAIIECANPVLVIGVEEGSYAGRIYIPANLPVDTQSPQPLPEQTSPHERAMASGGSTGLPKLIVAANAAVYDPQRTSVLFKGRQAVLVPGALYHGAPFSAAFGGLFCGCKVVVTQRFDALRYLQTVGDRRCDMVLCGGRNIYPAKVEAAIDSLSGVRSSALIALPDDDLGQRLHAIVDAGPGVSALNEALIRQYWGERLVHYKIPSSIEIVTTLLRDDAGKMRLSALRAARLPC